ncbi:MAG: CHAD domain-containing protein, partial [Dehalococcoidia bacterium]
MASPASHTESEWQFAALDVTLLARWLESANIPGYTVVEAGMKEVTDTYFDTDDWRLQRAGLTCRVREKVDGAELTIKTMADAPGGLRQRQERNEPISGNGVEAIFEAQGEVSRAVKLVVGRKPLGPLFTLKQRRRLFRLHDTAGDLGEISLDETTIPLEVEAAPVKLTRVEVEVTDVERAQRFVDVLVAATGLTPAATGKFQSALIATGMRVVRPQEELGPTAIDERMSVGEVAFAVLRKHFGAFLANEGGTRLGEDIEALHDMRVAARRMRAAMSLFRAYLPVRMESLRLELGWVAAALGEVRDLDVQLERMEEWRAGFDEERAHALDAVEAILHVRRQHARARMLNVLNSRRYESFTRRFAARLGRGPARSFAPGRVSILAVAPDLIEKRYRRVRKQARAIGRETAPEAYHQLRIDGKKLRYALEFVGPIYGRPALDFARGVTALQDVLGLHQDAYVAIDLLEELARTQSRRLSAATMMTMGAISERYRQDAVALRKRFPKVWKQLARAEWK